MRFLNAIAPEPVSSDLAPWGHLETRVMELLWEHGESVVQGVVDRLERPLAYTTVMTTMDRLYKKGVLCRRKTARAYLYAPRWSRTEWEQKRAGEFVAGFLSGPAPQGELLLSCLVEAVGKHDESLLHDLEERIRLKRKELRQRRKA